MNPQVSRYATVAGWMSVVDE